MSPQRDIFDFGAYWNRSRALHDRMAAAGVRMFLVSVANVCWEWLAHADKTRDAFRDDVRRFLDSDDSTCLTSRPDAPALVRAALTAYWEAAGYVRLTDLAIDSWNGEVQFTQMKLAHQTDEEVGLHDGFGHPHE